MAVPKRVCERLTTGMKRLGPALAQQRTRDVSEADTVTLVKDLLSDVFGYDKYSELTSEFAIRGTWCDLTIQVGGKITHIVEVKAIGLALEDRHVKQAIDYAANQGVEWVILTNAVAWRLYHVVFAKPIDKALVAEIDIPAIDCRRGQDIEALWPFTKEGSSRGVHIALRDRQAALSRFTLAALLLNNDAVLAAIRRELRRMVDINVESAEIARILADQVVKRDALEGPPAEHAAALVRRAESKRLRAASVDIEPGDPLVVADAPVSSENKPDGSMPVATEAPPEPTVNGPARP